MENDLTALYDQLVNELVTMYQNGEFPGWIMTDDDGAQMRRDLPDGTYEFVDVGMLRTGLGLHISVHHAIVDLNDYTQEELWEIGSMYYETEEEFIAQGRPIMAECVFECHSGTYWGGYDVMRKTYLELANGKE